jgi:hypothetical protein
VLGLGHVRSGASQPRTRMSLAIYLAQTYWVWLVPNPKDD